MENKKYSSYKEIEQDLAILKIEREIYYQKVLLSIDKTKESILPSTSATVIGSLYSKVFSGTFGTILKIIIPFVIKWYVNRKRGD